MTKQEILDKLQKENPSSIPIFKAMDEYAKQQAIAFDIWKLKNHWVWDNTKLVYFKWEGNNMHETRLSHEEIYNKFIEHKLP